MIQGLSPILNILLLSLVASLGTGIGGLIAIIRVPGRRLYGLLMGITAGVMICLSFLELVNEAWEMAGFVTATLGFGAGASFMFLLDYFAPHMRFGEVEVRGAPETPPVHPADWRNPCADSESSAQNPCGSTPNPCAQRSPLWAWRGYRSQTAGRPLGMGRRFGRLRQTSRQNVRVDNKLVKTGLLLAVGITLHNLPEGIAVGAGYLHNPTFGLFIAIAIMMHNIPEGIATALPLCRGGVCRSDALMVAFLSGLAEPVGALLASAFLVTFQTLVPAALAFAGGVMVFITLDELIPTAREYGHEHYTALGIILGSMFVFVLSGVFGV
jgi:zinc transporter ZupT